MSKDTKPDAWMPLYIGDWDGDTTDLSCEEDGAYGRLVRSYWRKGPPKDDDIALARVVRMDVRAWKKVRPVLETYFQIGDGLWRHKRVDAELIRWSDKKAAASEKAKAAAEKRWAKAQTDAPSNAPSNAPGIPQAMLEQCPSSSPLKEEAKQTASSLQPGEPPASRPDGPAAVRPTEEPDTPQDAARRDIVDALGLQFASRYFDGSPVIGTEVRPGNDIAAKRLLEAAEILARHGLTIGETIPPKAQATA